MIKPELLLKHGATVKDVHKGEIIYREGEQSVFYLQLKTGLIKWIHIDEEGKEFIHEILEQGDSIGESPLFGNQLYDVTAVAEENSTLYRLKFPAFQQLLEEHPAVHFDFTSLLSRRLHMKLLQTKMLANCNPENRLMMLLSYLIEYKKNICFNCNRLLLTRKQLACMLGLRIETVIRTIKQLEQKEVLSIDKGKVHIKNMTQIIPR